MSRIGGKLIEIPNSVTVTKQPNSLIIKGPKGEITLVIPNYVIVQPEKESISIQIQNPKNPSQKALWGTMQRLTINTIKGVTAGFTKRLIISGIGYRVALKEKTLALEVGLSHQVEFTPPEDIDIKVEGNNVIIISGIDKQKVGQIAAKIRAIKKPEPYKGKGIAYEGETILRKAGKQGAGASKK